MLVADGFEVPPRWWTVCDQLAASGWAWYQPLLLDPAS